MLIKQQQQINERFEVLKQQQQQINELEDELKKISR